MLRAGGILIAPCDTVYGILGRVPDSESAIRALKGRAEEKPFIIFIGDPLDTALFSDQAPEPGILGLWPGPLTLILAARAGGSQALRCPDDPWIRSLMEGAGCPLYSTSVNRSGKPLLWKVADIEAEFGDSVGLFVEDGDREGGIPSTILDMSVRPYALLRQGELRVPEEYLRIRPGP